MLDDRVLLFGTDCRSTINASDLSSVFMDLLSDETIPLKEFENAVGEIIKLGIKHSRFFPKNIRRTYCAKTKNNVI